MSFGSDQDFDGQTFMEFMYYLQEPGWLDIVMVVPSLDRSGNPTSPHDAIYTQYDVQMSMDVGLLCIIRRSTPYIICMQACIDS